MKKLILIIILLFTFTSTTYANVICIETGEELTMLQTTDGWMAFSKPIAEHIANLKRHTVAVSLIEENGSQTRGTGIVIDKRHILTVNHVTSDTGKNFYYENEKAQPYWATAIKRDATHDLALLEIDKNAPDLIEPMTFTEPKPKETIYTIGHPLKGAYSLTEGEVNSNHGRLKIKISQGNSGGYVMNQQGELVGMITSQQSQVGNLAYMTVNEDIQNFLK